MVEYRVSHIQEWVTTCIKCLYAGKGQGQRAGESVFFLLGQVPQMRLLLGAFFLSLGLSFA